MMNSMNRLFVALVVLAFVQSCSTGIRQQSDAPPASAPYMISTQTLQASPVTQEVDMDAESVAVLPTPVPVATIDVSTLPPEFWMDLPVVPEGISDRVREIYERGLLIGNDPNAFSKVGDCHSVTPYFLADYDLEPVVYQLGEYAELQATIDYFRGSFGRPSLAAKQGLSTAGVLASLWADWKQCESNETPLDCEFRLHRPSFALISLGTNEAYDVKLDKTPFEGRLRRIIEHSIDQGVVPILSTKADNDEGDHYINYVTARLALEYELPLWNFWRAVQPLPQQGMRNSDHLTFAPTTSFTDYSQPEYLEYGMQMRNLTALQVLDVIRREITQPQVVVAPEPTIQATPEVQVTFRAGETLTSPIDGMTLVYVPAGEFDMGYSLGNLDARPIHRVSLNAYWMDRTEVTNAMYARFLNEVGNHVEGGIPWLDVTEPLVWISDKGGKWESLSGMEGHPIVGVSWYGAAAYCEWAGRNLPTEAQWEHAARGVEGNRFPWGDKGPTCLRSQYLGCGTRPLPVGSLPRGASPFGIYEMAGNVAEWVNDRYAADYYQQSPFENPTGPSNGYYRVVRGGSWGSSYIGLQSAHRDWAGADTQDSDLGFRCVLNP
jgi:formylglycine-generating enzyme required for sulfatase activity